MKYTSKQKQQFKNDELHRKRLHKVKYFKKQVKLYTATHDKVEKLRMLSKLQSIITKFTNSGVLTSGKGIRLLQLLQENYNREHAPKMSI